MNNSMIGMYIDKFESILPADEQVPSIVGTDWYTLIKSIFDDFVWSYYYSREIFSNPKFNKSTDEQTLEVIKRTLAIHLRGKSRLYDRMFNAYMADYNPLWNVDGVVGEVREVTKTGTDTDTHSGKDTTLTEDNGSVTKSGSETINKAGAKNTTRSGSETEADSGNDTVDTKRTTYDSDTLYPTDQDKTTYGKSTTHTYNNVTDTENYNNYSDTHTYNNVRDTRDLDGKSETTYASNLQKTLNLKDKDVFLQIRQGNIGVTKSSELLLDTLELYDNELMDFVKYVVNDCLNQITYAVY